MINSKSFFKFEEDRAQSGYGAAILVRDPDNGTDGKYSLLCASTTVPSVFGSSDSFEFDLLNMPTKGKVEGKPTLEDKEVEVLHHRNNAYRFYKLSGKVLDFLVISTEYTAYKFSGTVSYRPNDASNDIWNATYTITPMSASTEPIFDAKALCAETLAFANVIYSEYNVGTSVDVTTKQTVSGITYKVVKIASETNKETEAQLTTDYTVTGSKITFNTTGLFVIYAEDPSKEYARWHTTVYIEPAA